MPSHDSLFVANGTGIVSMRLMVHSSLLGKHQAELRLLFGVRGLTGLIYHEKFLVLARQLSNFSNDVMLNWRLDWWHASVTGDETAT